MVFLKRPWNRTKPPPGVRLHKADSINDRLFALWLNNEGGGTKVMDSVGNNHGSFAIGSGSQTWGPSKFGTAIQTLLANSQYITMGDCLQLERTDSFTLSTWVSITALNAASNETFFSKYNASPGRGYFIGAEAAGKIRVILRNTLATNSIEILTAAAYLNLATRWNHVVVTYDGSSTAAGVKVWINGVSAAMSGPVYDNLSATLVNTGATTIGSRNTADSFVSGLVENTRLYKRVIQPNEIHRLFTEPFAGLIVPRFRVNDAPTSEAFKSAWAKGSNQILIAGDNQ